MIVDVEKLITSNLYDVYVCRTFPVFPSDYHVCIVTLCKTSIVKYFDIFIFKALNINWISLPILFWIPNCTYMIVNIEEPIISYLYDGYVCRTFPVFLLFKISPYYSSIFSLIDFFITRYMHHRLIDICLYIQLKTEFVLLPVTIMGRNILHVLLFNVHYVAFWVIYD